jgi:hypothetical protein
VARSAQAGGVAAGAFFMIAGGSLRASQAASLECDRGTRGTWGASWERPAAAAAKGR